MFLPVVIGLVASAGVALFVRSVGLDAFHGYVIDNPGVPAWWLAWCFAYDAGAAAGLA